MKDCLEGIIDAKLYKVISLLIKNPEEYYHISRISSETSLPVATTFRIVRKLVALGVVEPTLISKFKIYRLAKNPKTKNLQMIFR